MDWLHTIFFCFAWIVAVVIAGISVYVFIGLPKIREGMVKTA